MLIRAIHSLDQNDSSTIIPGFLLRRAQNQSTYVVEQQTSLESQFIQDTPPLSTGEQTADVFVVSQSQTSAFPHSSTLNTDTTPDESNIIVLTQSQISTEFYTSNKTSSHFMSPSNTHNLMIAKASEKIKYPPILNTNSPLTQNNTLSFNRVLYPPHNLPNICYPPSRLMNNHNDDNDMDLNRNEYGNSKFTFTPAASVKSKSLGSTSREMKKVSFNLPKKNKSSNTSFSIDKPLYPSPPKKTIYQPPQLQTESNNGNNNSNNSNNRVIKDKNIDHDLQIVYPPETHHPSIKYPPGFFTPTNSKSDNARSTYQMNNSASPFKSTSYSPPMFNNTPSLETQSPFTSDIHCKDIIYPPKDDLNEYCNDSNNSLENSSTENSPEHCNLLIEADSSYILMRPPPLDIDNIIRSVDKQTQASDELALSETLTEMSEDNLTSTPLGDLKESKVALRESFDREILSLNFDSESEETNKKMGDSDSDR